jgi:hypothetical protein
VLIFEQCSTVKLVHRSYALIHVSLQSWWQWIRDKNLCNYICVIKKTNLLNLTGFMITVLHSTILCYASIMFVISIVEWIVSNIISALLA